MKAKTLPRLRSLEATGFFFQRDVVVRMGCDLRVMRSIVPSDDEIAVGREPVIAVID